MPDFIDKYGSLSLSSDPGEVEGFLTGLERILENSCLDEMSAFQLRCAVVEVVNNCIQHAYMEEAGHPIEITYVLGANRVQISVSDRGNKFPGLTVAAPSAPMSESGRGLEIVNAWVSELRFERNGEWNVCLLEQRPPEGNGH